MSNLGLSAHESLMSVEDSASDATGSSADSATGLALQLTLQPVWFSGRLCDRTDASTYSATCLVLRQTRRPDWRFNLLCNLSGSSADSATGLALLLTLCPGMNLLSSEENLGDERGLVAVRDEG